MANNIPFVVWYQWFGIAVSSPRPEDIHLIAEAYWGTFGAAGRQHVRDSVTPGRTTALQNRWQGYYTSWYSAGPGLPVITPWHFHTASTCLRCFRFLQQMGVISATGFFTAQNSFLRQAVNNGKWDLVHYLVHSYTTNCLWRPLNNVATPAAWVFINAPFSPHPPNSEFIPDLVVGHQASMRTWARKVSAPGVVLPNAAGDISWCFNHERMLLMAPWIDVAISRQLDQVWINVGLANTLNDPIFGETIWQALVRHANPNRIAVFDFMATKRYDPLMYANTPLGAFDEGFTFSALSLMGWQTGRWHAWATAIKMRDGPSENWFRQNDLVDPLHICSAADGTLTLNPLVSAVFPLHAHPANVRLIGFAATLAITAQNRNFLERWVESTRPYLHDFLVSGVTAQQRIESEWARIFNS